MISTSASAAAILTAGSDHYASAVGASMTARQLGGAIGVAVGMLLLEHPPLRGPMPRQQRGVRSHHRRRGGCRLRGSVPSSDSYRTRACDRDRRQ
ncbi:hypothetical protein [Nonomuraea dietziae]|uniref:hypothetical protein n=1 Tax=Nonomuraea dietziae TaxID=65515 RepID=UPI0033FC46B8